MSKLEELIQELCPNGVEYKTIGEIANISRGKVMSKDYLRENKGEYPVYSSQTENNGMLGAITTYAYDGEYLTWTTDGANAGTVFYRTGKFSITNVCGLIDNTSSNVNTKYLYYVLNKKAPNYVSSGMGNPKLMSNVMSKITIPIPPLEVQKEIVRLLDEFTAKTAELQSELNKEYEARKKQYEYYRDTLLNNNAEIPKIKLGEFAVISRGGNFQKKDFVDNGLPCIHYGQIYTHYGTYADTTLTTINEEAYSKSKKAKKNDIVMAVTSENIEDVCKSVAWLGDKDIAVSGHTAIISHHQNAKYLSYYFSSNAFFKQKKKLAHGTKVIEVTPNTLANIQVPLPSLEVQNRLVEVLDNFDSICSDLNIDLPAEIETRQKQYEYYRDSLLTFAETGHIMPQTDRQTDR